MNRFKGFYEAWNFLKDHRIFKDREGLSFFPNQCLTIDVVKVNPKNERIEDDKSKNTAVRIWLECGPLLRQEDLNQADGEEGIRGELASHDIDLDCGAPTFEEAIVKLANLVYEKYGRSRKRISRATVG